MRSTGGRKFALAGIALLALTVFASACSSKSSESTTTTLGATTTSRAVPNTPVSVPAWTPPVQATDLTTDASTPTVVSYGSDPNQNLEVFQSSGDPQGTIVYIHGGAWYGGSMQQNTSAVVQAQEEQERSAEFAQISNEAATGALSELKPRLSQGWDIVSIDYRLATDAAGPGIRAKQIMNDVDHAIRYIIANAKQLNLDMTSFVLSGGSAGGHLALMEALTASSGQFIDPSLPSALKNVKVAFDGIIAMVAPSDLSTVWQTGGIGTVGTDAVLGCAQESPAVIAGMPSCDPSIVATFSPITYTKAAASAGTILPPAYFAYGGQDTLVLISTQGQPEIAQWTLAAGPNQTWFDLPPLGTHNIDDNVNDLALDNWLANVSANTWSGSSAQTPTS